MDKRKFNGARVGENRNAGRKPKAMEIELIEKLTPLDELAFKELEKGIKSGSFQYLKLYFEYRYGKPKDNGIAEMEYKYEPFVIELDRAIN